MITQAELDLLWRTEQVLHAVARVVREKQLGEDALGYQYLAVCECAEGVQELAARIQREQLEAERTDL